MIRGIILLVLTGLLLACAEDTAPDKLDPTYKVQHTGPVELKLYLEDFFKSIISDGRSYVTG